MRRGGTRVLFFLVETGIVAWFGLLFMSRRQANLLHGACGEPPVYRWGDEQRTTILALFLAPPGPRCSYFRAFLASFRSTKYIS